MMAFANDTSLRVCAKVFAMSQITSWIILTTTEINNLYFSSKKTDFIQFKTTGTKRDSLRYIKIEGESLKQVNATKLLGLDIDNRSSSNDHLYGLSKRQDWVCFILSGFKTRISFDALKMYYLAHLDLPVIRWSDVRSLLECGTDVSDTEEG